MGNTLPFAGEVLLDFTSLIYFMLYQIKYIQIFTVTKEQPKVARTHLLSMK